jgi:small-conductance mechanosensitive channel
MSEWLQSDRIAQFQVFFLIAALGLVAWLVNFFTLKLVNHSQTSWMTRVSQQLKAVGTFGFWYLALVFLNGWYTESAHEHRLINIAQSLIAIMVVIRFSFLTVQAKNLARLISYTLVPLIALNAFDVLDNAIEALEVYSLQIGNIHLTLYSILRVIYFGIILFWLGHESNRIGKEKIRKQKHLNNATKEIFAKLFEVTLFVIIFLVLLNILGISITTLAVLGGAIGVGIGFGLQSIASNFISGLVILLDRSLAIGDYIELEDGRSGTIRELNLRAVTLETFDGKDIVVPNDIFFTQTFINWTHKNVRQRYAIDFNVAYSTDLDQLFPLVKAMLSAHPDVISGEDASIEEQPDIEIAGFGDNGIDLHIEFWMDAIDDGKYRVGGDLFYNLWKLMKENGFEFPFPQREVRLLQKHNEG